MTSLLSPIHQQDSWGDKEWAPAEVTWSISTTDGCVSLSTLNKKVSLQFLYKKYGNKVVSSQMVWEDENR